MSLYWAVLALLLSVSAPDDDVGQYKERPLDGSAYEIKCKEAPTCTLVQYSVRMCTKNAHLIDARLILTTATLLRVEDNGRIAERFTNNKTAQWKRLHFGTAFHGYIFDEKFVGNLAEAREQAAKVTDIILYLGSDHADSYEPINYAYNPELLQLRNGAKVDNINEHGPFSPCQIWNNIDGKYDNVVFTNGKSIEDNSQPSDWISGPGIYRFNIASGRMNELYFDPGRPENNYLS